MWYKGQTPCHEKVEPRVVYLYQYFAIITNTNTTSDFTKSSYTYVQ